MENRHDITFIVIAGHKDIIHAFKSQNCFIYTLKKWTNANGGCSTVKSSWSLIFTYPLPSMVSIRKCSKIPRTILLTRKKLLPVSMDMIHLSRIPEHLMVVVRYAGPQTRCVSEDNRLSRQGRSVPWDRLFTLQFHRSGSKQEE